jgi:hypothetical protein
VEPTCPNGHRGALERLERRRLPGIVVFLGFALFVVSLFGVLGGTVMVAFGKFLESQPAQTPDEIRADLKRESIPDPIVAALMAERDTPVTPEELKSLTPRQLEAVQHAQLATFRSILEPEAVRAASWVVLGTSIVGVVVGWLLRSKRSVLQCAECGAAVLT